MDLRNRSESSAMNRRDFFKQAGALSVAIAAARHPVIAEYPATSSIEPDAAASALTLTGW